MSPEAEKRIIHLEAQLAQLMAQTAHLRPNAPTPHTPVPVTPPPAPPIRHRVDFYRQDVGLGLYVRTVCEAVSYVKKGGWVGRDVPQDWGELINTFGRLRREGYCWSEVFAQAGIPIPSKATLEAEVEKLHQELIAVHRQLLAVTTAHFVSARPEVRPALRKGLAKLLE